MEGEGEADAPRDRGDGDQTAAGQEEVSAHAYVGVGNWYREGLQEDNVDNRISNTISSATP